MTGQGIDVQQVLDGVSSRACNSLTATYYLLQQKHRNSRALNENHSAPKELSQNQSHISSINQPIHIDSGKDGKESKDDKNGSKEGGKEGGREGKDGYKEMKESVKSSTNSSGNASKHGSANASNNDRVSGKDSDGGNKENKGNNDDTGKMEVREKVAATENNTNTKHINSSQPSERSGASSTVPSEKTPSDNNPGPPGHNSDPSDPPGPSGSDHIVRRPDQQPPSYANRGGRPRAGSLVLGESRCLLQNHH